MTQTSHSSFDIYHYILNTFSATCILSEGIYQTYLYTHFYPILEFITILIFVAMMFLVKTRNSLTTTLLITDVAIMLFSLGMGILRNEYTWLMYTGISIEGFHYVFGKFIDLW